MPRRGVELKKKTKFISEKQQNKKGNGVKLLRPMACGDPALLVRLEVVIADQRTQRRDAAALCDICAPAGDTLW